MKFYGRKIGLLTKYFLLFVLAIGWIFSGWPQIWRNPGIPPSVEKAYALNQLAKWDFNGGSTGWSTANDTATTDTCGAAGTAASAGMATFAYDGTQNNPPGAAGSFKAISGTGNNARYKSYIYQTITTPGTSGSVKIKGRFDYSVSATTWRASNVDGFIKIQLYNSANNSLLASLACIQLPGSNVSWTTLSFGSDYAATANTQYVVRVTFAYRNSVANAATLWVDNVIVNAAPVGLSASASGGTTDAALTWTASSYGSGAPGLNATTPYMVYRGISSGGETFYNNASTNSYTDTGSTGNTTYYYQVSNMDTNSVESPLSTEVSVKINPGAPTSLNFTNVRETTLRLNWTAPTGGADSYKVERCSGAGCGSTPSNFSQIVAGVTTAYYDDSSLTANTTYDYRVRSTGTAGDGPYSSVVEQTTTLVSITITDGVVAYGMLPSNATKSTCSAELNDAQVISNNGTVTENFNIRGQNSANWTLAATAGSDQYVHQFKNGTCATFSGGTALTTSDQTFASSIAPSGTATLNLQINTPNPSTVYTQQSVNVTITAIQP